MKCRAIESAEEEEDLRCQRIGERLKEQADARERERQRLRVKYLHEPDPEKTEEESTRRKKYSKKQVEAYCASLHHSHRDEDAASKAFDAVSFEFAMAAKKKDEQRRNDILGTRQSPKRSREQIEAYSDSLYHAHKDIGAHKKAVDMLSE